MSADLVKRLRHHDEYEPLGHDGWEAADRIDRLEQALVDLGVEHCIALNNLAEETALVGRLTDRAEKAEIGAEFFKGEVKLRNRIPSTNDTASDLYKKVEQLERELEKWRVNYGKLGLELTAEKALADRLYIELQQSGVLASLGLIDYRKARGL